MNDHKTRKTIIRRLLLSVLLSLLVGVLVYTLTLYMAWTNTRDMDGIRPKQWTTQTFLEQCEQAIIDHQKLNTSTPYSLDDFEADNSWFMTPVYIRESGIWVDGWGRPYLTAVEGTTLLVTSYGRDGKPGGLGLDHDLTTTDPNPYAATITLKQFLNHETTSLIRFSCMILSIISFVVVLALILSITLSIFPEKTTARITSVALSMLITFLAAAFVGLAIGILHVPIPPAHAGGH